MQNQNYGKTPRKSINTQFSSTYGEIHLPPSTGATIHPQSCSTGVNRSFNETESSLFAKSEKASHKECSQKVMLTFFKTQETTLKQEEVLNLLTKRKKNS